MSLQEFSGPKTWSALRAISRVHRHTIDHAGIGGFVLHSAAGAIGRLPACAATRRQIDPAAKGALVGKGAFLETVGVVAHEALREFEINFAFVLLNQRLPADAPGGGGRREIFGVEIFCFFGDELRVDGEVGAGVIAVLGSFQRDVFEAEFEAGDLAGFVVADEPGVGVTAVVAFFEDGGDLVDGLAVLEGFARPDEFGDAFFVEALEGGNRSFGDDDSGCIDAEVVTAVDETGKAIHDHVHALGGLNVEHDVPAFADGEVYPGVVSDDNFAVFGVIAGGDESAAVFRGGDGGRCRNAVLLVVSGDVIPGEFHPAVEGDDIPEVEFGAFLFQAFGDAFDLFAILRFDLGPEDFATGCTIKIPIFFRVVEDDGLDRFEPIGNFSGENATVLATHFTGCSSKLNLDPALLFRSGGGGTEKARENTEHKKRAKCIHFPSIALLESKTNSMDVREKVKQIIVEQLGVDEAQVDDTASFVDDLGADSLDIVELVMAFEEAFGIDVPDEDAEKLTTVKAAIDYIDSKKKK